MKNVPTIHLPNKKDLIRRALGNTDFQVQGKGRCSTFFSVLGLLLCATMVNGQDQRLAASES